MLGLYNELEKARLQYQKRYADYAKTYSETGEKTALGHMHECSYVLINFFGLSGKEIEQLVEAAALAPSAQNRQPLKYIVYTGKKRQDA